MSTLGVGPGACDTHVHFYDSAFPTSPAASIFPPDADTADYVNQVQRPLGLDRAVVVQPTTYGLDNSCQEVGMARIGKNARGVAVVDATTPQNELRRLDEVGFRGARFHLLPGGAVSVDDLAPVADRIAELGWHIQLQTDGNALPDLAERLGRLPCPLVIDHIGRYMPPPPLDSYAISVLRELVDRGSTWVKLSAPYESHPDPVATLPLVDQLVADAPERLLWASNWPHPGRTDPPSAADLSDLVNRWLPDPPIRKRVLVDNPTVVYGFGPAEEAL